MAFVLTLSLSACSKGEGKVEVKDGVDFELLDAVRAVSYTHLTLPTTPYV